DFRDLLGSEGWAGEGYELVNAGTVGVPEQAELALAAAAPLPAWARQLAPAEPDPPTPLAPSQPLPDEAIAGPRAFSPLASGDPPRGERGAPLPQRPAPPPGQPAAPRA